MHTSRRPRRWMAALGILLAGGSLAASHSASADTPYYDLTIESGFPDGGVQMSWTPPDNPLVILVCPASFTDTECQINGLNMPAGTYARYIGGQVLGTWSVTSSTTWVFGGASGANWSAGPNTALPVGTWQFRIINTSTPRTSALQTATISEPSPLVLTAGANGLLSWGVDLDNLTLDICSAESATADDCTSNRLAQLNYFDEEAPLKSISMNGDTMVKDNDTGDNRYLGAGTYGFVLSGSMEGHDTPKSNLVMLTVPSGPVPTVPVSVAATAGDRTAGISFAPGVANGASVVAYEYTIDGGRSTHRVDAGVRQAAATGLTNGVTYRAQVRALSPGGSSAWSAPATVTPQAGAGPALTKVIVDCTNDRDDYSIELALAQGASLTVIGDANCDVAYNYDFSTWTDEGQTYFETWPGQASGGTDEFEGPAPFTWTVASDAPIGAMIDGEDEGAFRPYVFNYDSEYGAVIDVTIEQSPAPSIALDETGAGSLTWTIAPEDGTVDALTVTWPEEFGQVTNWSELAGTCPTGMVLTIDGTPTDITCEGGPQMTLGFGTTAVTPSGYPWQINYSSGATSGQVVRLEWTTGLVLSPETSGVYPVFTAIGTAQQTDLSALSIDSLRTVNLPVSVTGTNTPNLGRPQFDGFEWIQALPETGPNGTNWWVGVAAIAVGVLFVSIGRRRRAV